MLIWVWVSCSISVMASISSLSFTGCRPSRQEAKISLLSCSRSRIRQTMSSGFMECRSFSLLVGRKAWKLWALGQKAGDDCDRTVDRGIVHVEMGDGPQTASPALGEDHSPLFQRLEEGFRRKAGMFHPEKDHVGLNVGRVDLDAVDLGQSVCQAPGPAMIFGQTVDMVIQGVKACGGDDPSLAHRPSQSLLVPAGPGDRLRAACQKPPRQGRRAPWSSKRRPCQRALPRRGEDAPTRSTR